MRYVFIAFWKGIVLGMAAVLAYSAPSTPSHEGEVIMYILAAIVALAGIVTQPDV